MKELCVFFNVFHLLQLPHVSTFDLASHISKETQRYLQSMPNRFEFVFTPKHGSWLNMIEMFFSKIARGFLRHIRVESKEELKNRILQGIEEINQEPVVFRWKYKMDEISLAQ